MNEFKDQTPLEKEKADTIQIPVGRYLKKLRNNPWVASTFVLGLVLLAVLIFNPLGKPPTGSVVSGEIAGQKALDFINSNPALEGEVTLVSVQETDSFYEAILDYQGQQVPVYLTLDGKYLLSGEPVSLAEPPEFPPVENINEEPPEAIEVSLDDDAMLGDPKAPITIVEFSDYECPFCGRFYSETLPQIKENYIETGKVRLVFRDFPLSFHPSAQISAEAAECVKDKGGDEDFWKYHDKLFENQASLSEDNLKKWAKELGHDISECLSSSKFKEEVESDFAEGNAYGVTGTPSFFINGKIVSGALPYEQFEQILEAELAETAS